MLLKQLHLAPKRITPSHQLKLTCCPSSEPTLTKAYKSHLTSPCFLLHSLPFSLYPCLLQTKGLEIVLLTLLLEVVTSLEQVWLIVRIHFKEVSLRNFPCLQRQIDWLLRSYGFSTKTRVGFETEQHNSANTPLETCDCTLHRRQVRIWRLNMLSQSFLAKAADWPTVCTYNVAKSWNITTNCAKLHMPHESLP